MRFLQMNSMEFQKECLEVEYLDDLIFVLQEHRKQHGNIRVYMCMSANKDEGDYDIDAVLYSTDEDGEETISLISW